MVVNHSRDSEYHSQRNNLIIPHSSCNTTAMIMALKQAGVRLPFPVNIQPEDHLTAFLQTEKALEKMRELTPWAINQLNGTALYPPQEVHSVLAWAVNYLLNREVVTFSTKTDFEEIIQTINNGGGAVLSGLFPLKNRSLHHMVSLAGYMEHQNRITYLIVDDPYGDYQTDYRSHRGNNIPIPIDRALKILKPADKALLKWAHLIKSNVPQ